MDGDIVEEEKLGKFELFLLVFQLAETEEYVNGNCTGNLGEVLIRCNNVLYVKSCEDEDTGGDAMDQ